MTDQNNTQPQTNVTDWTQTEIESLGTNNNKTFEKLPALKLVENKIANITIDFNKPFETYNDTDLKGQPVTKAIIPVFAADGGTGQLVKMNWWLNKKNPVYRKLLEMAKGKTSLEVKIMQTGTQKNTKYIIVE